MAALPEVITARVIARTLGVSAARIQRILDSRTDLQPKAMADGVSVYDHDTVASCRYAINVEDAKPAIPPQLRSLEGER